MQTQHVNGYDTAKEQPETQNVDQGTAETYMIHPAPTTTGTDSYNLPVFVDGTNNKFQFVRIPKERDFELFRVPRNDQEICTTAELPLTATKPDGETKVIMWAIMDTGSVVNLINETTLDELLGPEIAHRRRRPMTKEQFELIDDHHFNPGYSVDLDFVAGKRQARFTKVNFIIVPGEDAVKANSDGVPNVLLGYPFLRENEIVMIGEEYCCEPEEGLRIIADRAEKERSGMSGIFSINKGTKMAGIPKPTPPPAPRPSK